MCAAEQSEAGTRERILDAAERLFGERGFEVVSLRDITGLAEANVASVNYHFGSKEKLIDAVVERHAAPVNERRMMMLDAAEERHGEAPVPVREMLEAFLRPMIAHILDGRMSEDLFCKFMGRMMSERGYCLPKSVEPVFQQMSLRFAMAFLKSVPGLTEQEVLWRMHFSFGVLSNTLMHRDTLQQISQGRAGDPGMEVLMDGVLDFTAAGFVSGAEGRAEP